MARVAAHVAKSVKALDCNPSNAGSTPAVRSIGLSDRGLVSLILNQETRVRIPLALPERKLMVCGHCGSPTYKGRCLTKSLHRPMPSLEVLARRFRRRGHGAVVARPVVSGKAEGSIPSGPAKLE